jgi:hypothetical protein
MVNKNFNTGGNIKMLCKIESGSPAILVKHFLTFYFKHKDAFGYKAIVS